MNQEFSEVLDKQLEKTVADCYNSYNFAAGCSFNKAGSCDFETLLGFGTLVDMLAIVNIKLYNLLDESVKRKDDKEFMAKAAVDNIALVLERSRLKKCIDQKISALMRKVKLTDHDGLNPETKFYGVIN